MELSKFAKFYNDDKTYEILKKYIDIHNNIDVENIINKNEFEKELDIIDKNIKKLLDKYFNLKN